MKLALLLCLTSGLVAQSTSAFYACGNPNPYTDSTTQVWAADNGTNCTGGTTFHTSNAIQGTPDPTLYQYGRQGPSLSATAALAVGIYRIQLKFADVLGPAKPGSIIFSIYVNGSFQLNFDMYQTIRSLNAAYDVVIPLYANLSGTVTVQMFQVTGNAQLQAVSFISVGAGGGGGTMTMQYNGATVGTRPILNFAPGTGILINMADTGFRIDNNITIDPGQVVTTKTATLERSVGGCTNGGTFSPGSWVQSGAQTGSCNGSSQMPFLTLANVGSVNAISWFRWPADFNPAGAVNVYVTFTDASNNGGNAKLDFSLACVAAGTATNALPTFNAITTTGVYSLTGVGAGFVTKEQVLSSLNDTGCAAHQLVGLMMSRDNTIGSNSPDGLNIIQVTVEYVRN